MVAGNIADLGIALQIAKGVAAANSTWRVLLADGGLDTIVETKAIVETTSQRLRSQNIKTATRGEGTPTIVGRPRTLPFLLYATMGAKAVAGAADPWTHTFTLAAELPYLTAWKNLGGLLFEKYVDAKVGSTVLTSESGSELRAATMLLARGPEYAGIAEVGGATTDQDAPFVHYDAESNLKVEGTPVSSISRTVVTIENGTEIIPGDSIRGYDVRVKLLSITIEVVNLIENLNLYNRLHYGTANPAAGATPTRDILELGGAPAGLDLKWIRQATPERSLEILAPRVKIASMGGFTPATDGGQLTQTVTYEVLQPASGSGLTAIAKNAVATY